MVLLYAGLIAVGGSASLLSGLWFWRLLRRSLPEALALVCMIPFVFLIFVGGWFVFAACWTPTVIFKRLREGKRGLAIAAPGSLLCGLLSLTVLFFWGASQGGSFDPTDPANFNQFMVVDNLAHGVNVDICAGVPCSSRTTLDRSSPLFRPDFGVEWRQAT